MFREPAVYSYPADRVMCSVSYRRCVVVGRGLIAVVLVGSSVARDTVLELVWHGSRRGKRLISKVISK